MNLLQKLYLLICPIILCGPPIFSQSDQIFFESITTERGLSQNDVNCIFQDRKGFMWFGTNDGLNRYDGYSIEVFKPDLSDPFSINSNLILALTEDSRGLIWIGTAGKGLNCYNPVSKKFYHFPESSDSAHQAINEHIINLYVDEQERLWVATLDGMELFELRTNQTDSKREVPELFRIPLPEFVQRGRFSKIRPGFGQSIWLTGGNEVYRVDLMPTKNESFHFEEFVLFPDLPNLIVNDFSIYLSHGFLVASNLGLYYFPDINENQAEEKILLGTGTYREIQIDRYNQILGGSSNGLAQYRISESDSIPQLIRIHHNDLNVSNSLSKDVVLSLAMDNHGLIWVGTNGGGVNKFDPAKKAFSHFMKTLNPGSISYNKIRSIFEDSRKNLWIGTEGGGLNFLALEDDDGNYEHFQSLTTPEMFFAITEVPHPSSSHIFLGAQSNPGLFMLNIPKAGKPLSSETITIFSEINSSVFALLNDENNHLWAGTYNGGLYRLKIGNDGQYQLSGHFLHSPQIPRGLSNDIIRSLLKDKEGNIWVGTGKGLNQIPANQKDKLEPTFVKYFFTPEDSLSLSHNYILALHESRAGDLWVGTFGGGINKWVPGNNGEKGHFIRYSEKEGLANDVVKGILEDDLGHLWLATNKGISRFDPSTTTFKNFDTHDGLQSKEFSELACFVRSNGEFLFGGVNGFNSFFPENIKDNVHVPEVVFTNLEIVNKPISVGDEFNGRVLLPKAISEIHHIDLKHDENSFSLAFAALHFSAPEKNQYQYKLEGFDEDWIKTNSKKRFATYTNLSPGEYTIYVKATNNDGVWNEQASSISINIAPPFWKTWYAYIFYGLLILGLLVAVQQYTVIGIKEKHALVLEHLEKEKAEELNQLKLQFFTNISHELRTPLTLISGPMDYLINSGKGMGYNEREYQYNLIKKNTNYLLRLVNQLLEFRKIDRGKIQLKVQQGEIESFIQEILEPFQFIANKKQINYQLIAPPMDKDLWYDATIIEKVLYNLLSNAFKFTPKYGEIDVELRLNNKEQDILEISVRDTGPGISPKNQERIFERYYNDSQLRGLNTGGTGIGLSYTKSLIDLHKGSIVVESEEGKGTAFIVRIPIDKKTYSKSEIILNESEQPAISQDPLTYLTDFAEEDPRELTSEAAKGYTAGLAYLLVVDDNKDIRTHIRLNLKEDYNIIEAENGEEGLKLANEIMPDMIISDILMPVMNGIDFCERIKTEAKTSHIPIVLLTAKSSEESEIEGLKIGADAYIRKPFHMETLKAKLQNILSQRSKLKDRFRKQVILEPKEIAVSSTDEIFLKKAMDLVEEHMADPDFNVENMVQEIGMSRSKLYLKLKALTGQSSSEFIRTVRLKRAVQLLESSDLTVKEIMYMTGFNTASYFSKCFKKQFGISPSEYVTKPSKKQA